MMRLTNPFAQAPQPIQVIVAGAVAMLDAVEYAIEEGDACEVLAVTRAIDAVVPHLVILVDAPQREKLHEAIARAALPFAAPDIREMKLADIDWVSKVQKDFPPFTMGPFYVYGSHAKQGGPPNHLPLLIDAAAAFGTGEHGTTAGCLLALAREQRTRRRVDCVLDVGCGTAILAIGAARLWKNARIVACDYDPVAVKVSAHNLRVNRIANRSTAFVSNGYKARPMHGRTYPVIVANILAKPLMKMAHDASQFMAKDGTLILSGLLRSQEPMVLSAHRAQGRYLKGRIRRGNWSVLILR